MVSPSCFSFHYYILFTQWYLQSTDFVHTGFIKKLFEVFKKHLLDKCYSYMKDHRSRIEKRNSNLCSQRVTHPSLWRCFYWFYFPRNRLIFKWWCCQIITWETPNFLQASRKFSTFLRHFAMLSLGYKKKKRERQTFISNYMPNNLILKIVLLNCTS